jgi:hypothetical protein
MKVKVEGHMDYKPRTVIFSLVGMNSKTSSNEAYKLSVEKGLNSRNIAFKHVVGSYKGTVENSIVAVVEDDVKLDYIRALAFKHDDQESILVINEDRNAFLEFNTGTTEKLGAFRHIDALKASQLDAWTLDGTDYYAVL